MHNIVYKQSTNTGKIRCIQTKKKYLLLLFKAHAKIFSGKTKGGTQGEITQNLMLDV